jgi:hypothetical protein
LFLERSFNPMHKGLFYLGEKFATSLEFQRDVEEHYSKIEQTVDAHRQISLQEAIMKGINRFRHASTLSDIDLCGKSHWFQNFKVSVW